MLDREERRGVLWIALFVAFLLVASIALLRRTGRLSTQASSKGPPAVLPLGTVNGAAVDALDGEPIDNVRVELVRTDARSAHWREEPDPIQPHIFTLGGLPAPDTLTLELSAEHHLPRRVDVRTAAGAVAELGEIELEPLRTLTLHLRDGAGRPAPAGVVVEVLEDGRREKPAWQSWIAGSAVSDERGVVHFPSLPPRRFLLRVESGRAASIQPRATEAVVLDLAAAPPGMEATLVLAPESAGRIRPPRDEDIVTARDERGFEWTLSDSGLIESGSALAGRQELTLGTRTGKRTRVHRVFPGLHDTDVELPPLRRLALAAEHRPWRIAAARSFGSAVEGFVDSVDVARGPDPDPVLSVRSAGRLQVLVVAADGAVGTYDGSMDAFGGSLAWNDEAVGEIPAGCRLFPFTASVRERALLPSEGVPPHSSSLPIAELPAGWLFAATHDRFTRDLAMPRPPLPPAPFPPAIQLQDQNGRPIARADVRGTWSTGPERRLWHLTRTDAEGRLDRPWPPTWLGAVEWTVEVLGFQPVRFAETSASPVTIELLPAASLRLSLIDEEGDPIRGARLVFDDPIVRSRWTNEDGIAVWSDLPAGTRAPPSLEFDGRLLVPAPAVDCVAGEEAVMELVAFRPWPLALTVRDGAEPAPGVRGTLFGRSHCSAYRAELAPTDEHGRTSLEGRPLYGRLRLERDETWWEVLVSEETVELDLATLEPFREADDE